MTRATRPAEADVLTLQPAEQALLAAEVTPFAATLNDPALRQRYEELAAAAATGHIPAPLVGLLETLAELILQTQRVRRRHGPEAERTLKGLYDHTPRGQQLKQAAREVNEALEALHGQVLEGMTFTPIPGGQRLSITTQACQLELVLDRAGVRVERVEVGSVSG